MFVHLSVPTSIYAHTRTYVRPSRLSLIQKNKTNLHWIIEYNSCFVESSIRKLGNLIIFSETKMKIAGHTRNPGSLTIHCGRSTWSSIMSLFASSPPFSFVSWTSGSTSNWKGLSGPGLCCSERRGKRPRPKHAKVVDPLGHSRVCGHYFHAWCPSDKQNTRYNGYLE